VVRWGFGARPPIFHKYHVSGLAVRAFRFT
jgi:hypothetical protein